MCIDSDMKSYHAKSLEFRKYFVQGFDINLLFSVNLLDCWKQFLKLFELSQRAFVFQSNKLF